VYYLWNKGIKPLGPATKCIETIRSGVGETELERIAFDPNCVYTYENKMRSALDAN
jgi:hypothetical protein